MNRRDIGQQSESAGGQVDAESVELVGHFGAAAMYTPSTVRWVDGKPRSMDQIGAAAIHAVTVQADYAYAVAQYFVPGHKGRYTVYRGQQVVDVSHPLPLNPPQIGYYNTPGYAMGVCVSGGLLYLADRDGGLFIMRHTGATTEDLEGRLDS